VNSNDHPSASDLALLEQVIRQVARAARLSPDETLDFSQSVHLRVLQRDYEVFRQFSARSSLKTYLTTVVRRILVDWYRGVRGKWRASAAALKLGRHAVDLERLTHRDGFTLHEALQLLHDRGATDTATLRRLADELPLRERRRMVSDDALSELRDPHFEDPVDQWERQRRQRAIRRALSSALRQLSPDDRRLISLRYGQNRRVSAVADLLHADAKTLYRRCDRVLRTLRVRLETAGVTGSSTITTP
jgi:RNA polymerase sigma factor (sigma-70 family)